MRENRKISTRGKKTIKYKKRHLLLFVLLFWGRNGEEKKVEMRPNLLLFSGASIHTVPIKLGKWEQASMNVIVSNIQGRSQHFL